LQTTHGAVRRLNVDKEKKPMRQITKIGVRTAVVAVALGVAFAPRLSAAQDNPSQDKPSQDMPSHDMSTSTATTTNKTFTVKKIDKANRMLTLTDPQGQQHEIKATQDVDLDKIKMGQRLNVTYYDEVALAIQKTGQAMPKISQSEVQRGGVTAKQTTVTAKILSVDTTNNSVVVQGPSGEKHTLQVKDSEVQAQLGKIRPGDAMQVTYTQALAVSAEPAK
jgi:hypothetical protein